MKAVAWICLTILLLVLGAVLAPKGAAGLEFLTGPRSEDAAAAYALSHRTTADYVREIDSAIAAGDAVGGCSVHVVTEELDGGVVLGQAEVPILAGDNADTLAERVLAAEHALYPKTLAEFVTR